MNPNQMFGVPSYNPPGIIWVNGYEEAKKYQVPKKSNIVLFDSSIEGRFYIKIADDIGMYNIRFFDYKEIFPNNNQQQQQQNNQNSSNYITYDQLVNILSNFKDNIVNEVKANEQSISTTQSTASIPNYKVVNTDK